MMFTRYQECILGDLLNEEIKNYIESGYDKNCEYIIELRKILKILGLKEIYNFDIIERKKIKWQQ